MRSCVRGMSVVVVVGMLVSVAFAAIPRLINFQGRLTDDAGNPVADESYNVAFTIHTDSLAGVQLWGEVQAITTQQGLFHVQLGQVNPLADSIFSSGPNLFLAMSLRGAIGAAEEMAPRTRLTASAFSFRALHADTAQFAMSGGSNGGAGGWVDDGTTVRLETGTDKVGIGVTSTTSKLGVNGDINVTTYYRIRDTTVLRYAPGRTLCVGSFAGGSFPGDECTLIGTDVAHDGGGLANTCVGFRAGYATEGDYNIFIGHSAGYSNELGHNNVIIGSRAGYAATGSGNVFIGCNAGYNEIGDNKLYIADTSGTPLIYGDFSSGKIGLGTTSPTAKLHVSDVVRITGATMWPSSGEGLELGYSASLNRGYVMARDRTSQTWSNLFLGDGNVGIGIYDPPSKLSVSGGEGSVNLLLEADTENIGEADQPSITMTQDGGQVVGEIGFFDAGNDFAMINRYSGCLNFGTADSLAMMITPAQNVGIGVLAPANTHRLKVWSDATGSSNSTLLAQNGAAAGANGIALHAVSNGTALLAVGGAIGVSSSTSLTGGKAMVAAASGSNGTALRAEVYNSTAVGIEAYGGASAYSAKFHGNVALYSLSDGHQIMELGEGLDYAEGFDISPDAAVQPGTVLVIDPENPGRLGVSQKPYDRKVAGIAAGAGGLGSGVRLGGEKFDVDVALAGRVYCNVDASQEGIEAGDLLTTSEIAGFAMKVTDFTKANGAILGKAMEPLAKGTRGQILVLVTLQ